MCRGCSSHAPRRENACDTRTNVIDTFFKRDYHPTLTRHDRRITVEIISRDVFLHDILGHVTGLLSFLVGLYFR